MGFINDAVSAAPDEPTTLDPMWWVELGPRLGKNVVVAVACSVFPEAHVFIVFFSTGLAGCPCAARTTSRLLFPNQCLHFMVLCVVVCCGIWEAWQVAWNVSQSFALQFCFPFPL